MLGTLMAFTLNGIVLGLIYAVVALGFTLILGVMEVINFTHGVLFAYGAYLAYTLQPFLGFWLSMLVAPLLVGLMGLAIEFFLVRRVYGQNPLFGLLLTFGLSMALEEMIRMIWGRVGRSVTAPAFVAGSLDLGFMLYSRYRLFLAALAILVILAVWYFLMRTPYGAVIRAGAFDAEMVMALGKNLPWMRSLVFALGAVLAGIAGVIAAPIWSIRPPMGTAILMPSYLIVVLGGIGSFWGTIIGGLIIGISTSISVMIFPRISDLVPYLLMALVLIWRPRGLMGEKSILEV